MQWIAFPTHIHKNNRPDWLSNNVTLFILKKLFNWLIHGKVLEVRTPVAQRHAAHKDIATDVQS